MLLSIVFCNFLSIWDSFAFSAVKSLLKLERSEGDFTLGLKLGSTSHFNNLFQFIVSKYLCFLASPYTEFFIPKRFDGSLSRKFSTKDLESSLKNIDGNLTYKKIKLQKSYYRLAIRNKNKLITWSLFDCSEHLFFIIAGKWWVTS